jgi:hypothetical protein
MFVFSFAFCFTGPGSLWSSLGNCSTHLNAALHCKDQAAIPGMVEQEQWGAEGARPPLNCSHYIEYNFNAGCSAGSAPFFVIRRITLTCSFAFCSTGPGSGQAHGTVKLNVTFTKFSDYLLEQAVSTGTLLLKALLWQKSAGVLNETWEVIECSQCQITS